MVRVVYAILLLNSLLFVSCSLKARFCYYDPGKNTVNLKQKTTHIIRISVSSISDEGKFKETLFETKFDSAVNTVFLQKYLDVNALKGNYISIWIYDRNSIMYAYSIDIKKEDWGKRKKIYGYYNAY